jgi:hypothetical protein
MEAETDPNTATGEMDRPKGGLIYVNATRTLGGAFDLTLDLGYQRGAEPPDWVVSVAMSWEHAQALAASLEDVLKRYQDQVGPLPDIQRLRVEKTQEAQQ